MILIKYTFHAILQNDPEAHSPSNQPCFLLPSFQHLPHSHFWKPANHLFSTHCTLFQKQPGVYLRKRISGETSLHSPRFPARAVSPVINPIVTHNSRDSALPFPGADSQKQFSPPRI